jgi:hypothetical protein
MLFRASITFFGFLETDGNESKTYINTNITGNMSKATARPLDESGVFVQLRESQGIAHDIIFTSCALDLCSSVDLILSSCEITYIILC